MTRALVRIEHYERSDRTTAARLFAHTHVSQQSVGNVLLDVSALVFDNLFDQAQEACAEQGYELPDGAIYRLSIEVDVEAK